MKIIRGVYSKTKEVRRMRPVWYNFIKNTFIFVSKDLFWLITNEQNYIEDTFSSYAFAYSLDKTGKPRCPEDRDYSYSIKNKVQRGMGVNVTASNKGFELIIETPFMFVKSINFHQLI